jgi:hypothetical protein
MVWPLIAMAAMSMMSQNKEAAGAALSARDRALDWTEQSKATMEANQKNFQAQAFRVGMLNVQKAQEVRALEQRKFDAGQQEQAALGSAAVNAAASGTVGASVDAVQTDIQMAFDRVRAQISDENELNALNFNTELYDLITNGTNQIMSSGNFRKSPKGVSQIGMAAGAAFQVAGTYVGAKMDLGLGPRAETQPSFGAQAGFTLTR